MGRVEVVIVATLDERDTAYAIRREVFIDEQEIPADEEFDDIDPTATHVLVRVDGEPAGTGRVYFEGAVARIGRMAVRKAFRRHGVGREVLRALMRLAVEGGAERLVLHAQMQAVGFYGKEGFTAVGEPFDEAGIPHCRMERATAR